MTSRIAWLASSDPPEPARALMPHLLRAAREIGPLPAWVDRYPLTAMSPSARQLAWAVGRHLQRNPDHGFAIAARVPADAIGSLWQLYCAAPDLGWIYRHYDRWSVLLLDCADVQIAPLDRGVRVRFPMRAVKPDRAEEDFRAGCMVTLWRALHQRDDVAPLAVGFTYPRPRSTAAHRQALGEAALRFSEPCFSVELSHSLWTAPLKTSDEAACERLYQAARAAAREVEERPWTAQIESLMMALLSKGASASQVASELGTSERTLRRRLGAAGKPFRDMLLRVRRREAELLAEIAALDEPRAVGVGEQARLLGFANRGAFRNALRRWSDG